ncbi:MAG: MMPL family transporter, partial [Planctomycetota bacterium]
METARRQFGAEDAVLLILLQDDRPREEGSAATDKAADASPGVLSAEALAWQQRLAAALPDLPHVAGVAGLPTLQTSRLSFARFGTYETVPLVPGSTDAPPTEPEAAWVRQQLADGRADGLVSENRRTVALLAILDPAARSETRTRETTRAVEALLEADPPPAGMTAALGGMPALRLAIVESLAKDGELLFPLAGGLFLVALTLAFRRPVGVIVSLISVACGLCWAGGLLSAFGTTFGILANVLPVLLTVVGFAAAVHLLARNGEEGARTPDRADAAKRTFVATFPAIWLTLGTTAIGFGSLLAANSDAVRALAVQAATGLICLAISTLATFAALAGRFRPPRPPRRTGRRSPIVRLGAWAAGRRRTVLAAGAAVTLLSAVSAAGSSRLGLPGTLWNGLTVDSRMTEMYEDSHPAARAMRRVERDLGGAIAVEVLIFAPADADPATAGLLEPSRYAAAVQFEAAARELPGVLSVRGYPSLYQRTLAGMRRDPESRDEAPFGRGAARRLRQAGALIERTAPGSTAPFLSKDAASGRIVIRIADFGTAQTLRLIDRLERLLADFFPVETTDGTGGPTWRLTGDGYVNAVGMNQFIRDFLGGLALATLVIFGVIGTLFRSLRAGLIAMIPNLTPLLLTLGYLRLRGLDLSAGNAIVFAVGVGVAVDDTIHFLARFPEELGKTADLQTAVARTLAASGRAIVLTSG